MKKLLMTLGLTTVAATGIVTAQTANERAQITSGYNISLLNSLAKQYATAAAEAKQTALDYARKNNIPVLITNPDGSIAELIRIDEGNVPVYFTNKNVNAAKSTRANYLNTGGGLGLDCNGQNMTVAVWDGGGVRTTHQELTGRVTIGDNANATGDPHATHVGGTIAASGVVASAKGMAPQASIRSYEWNSDLSEMTTAASQGLLMSNHSYGYRAETLPDWYFGAYITESRDWDDMLFSAPYYVVCKAAGNDGTSADNGSPLGGSTTAYDKLSGPATSKNVIVVANAQDASINASGDLSAVTINASSSQGPTDDLRIKPDIAGNGTTVYSSVSSSNTAYGTMTGTSMASPNVAGTLTLVNQHFKNVTGNYMLGAALRGLALHTADDAGASGPDAVFGWGLANAKKMAETINTRNTTSMISDRNLANGATDTILVNSDGITPLRVSISWYDRGGTAQTSSQLNNTTVKRLINNLDLRVKSVSSGTIYNPWVLTSRSVNAQQDNNNDNFERVDVGVVPAGQYAIAISHKGTLTGGSQNYTLVVTGKSNGSTATCNAPTNLTTTNITASSATLSWAAASSANQGYTVEYKAATASTWTVAYTGTATTTGVTGLTAATNYNWRVKTNCNATTSSAYADASFTTTGSPAVCNAPTNLQSSNITQNTATVSFTASSSANTGYTVEYKTSSAAAWTSAGTAAGTSRSLTGLTAATTYQWRVRTHCNATSTSDFVNGSFTTSAPPATSCATAFEANNTLATAYTISTGSDYLAAIGTSGDVDYYKVTVPYGNYTVSLTGLTHDVDLKIQNAAGTTLATSENSGTSSEQIAATFGGGTYYFRVYPWSGYDANNCYTFKMTSGTGTQSMAEGLVNTLIDNAHPLVVYPNPAQQQITMRLSEKSGPGSAIRIVDMTGKEVMKLKGTGGDNRIDISALSPGNYMIEIDNRIEKLHKKFTKL